MQQVMIQMIVRGIVITSPAAAVNTPTIACTCNLPFAVEFLPSEAKVLSPIMLVFDIKSLVGARGVGVVSSVELVVVRDATGDH